VEGNFETGKVKNEMGTSPLIGGGAAKNQSLWPHCLLSFPKHTRNFLPCQGEHFKNQN
jgi:hypothetical protein